MHKMIVIRMNNMELVDLYLYIYIFQCIIIWLNLLDIIVGFIRNMNVSFFFCCLFGLDFYMYTDRCTYFCIVDVLANSISYVEWPVFFPFLFLYVCVCVWRTVNPLFLIFSSIFPSNSIRVFSVNKIVSVSVFDAGESKTIFEQCVCAVPV